MTIARLATSCLLGLSLLAAAGCCSFDREWRDSLCCVPGGDGLDGLWEGTWRSGKNDHSGRLRAIITRCDEGSYRTRFHAVFWEVLPFEFTLAMTSAREGGAERFEGQADLGPLAGGVYTYAGVADACEFNATYCARSDHGVFHMRRVR
ncbi:MAG TPA: hypothetical protein VML55_20285 [Planctomycetaceae bacterium]|nr:hypothetical protein [Planctomycetaceae bacterium]